MILEKNERKGNTSQLITLIPKLNKNIMHKKTKAKHLISILVKQNP